MLAAEPKFAVQVMVVVPQPELIVTLLMSVAPGTIVRDPVPVNVNMTGEMTALTVTLWLPPLVIEIVGAGGVVIVTVAAVVAIWP